MMHGFILMALAYLELARLEDDNDYWHPAVRALQQVVDVNLYVGDDFMAGLVLLKMVLVYEALNKTDQHIEAAQQAEAYFRACDANAWAQSAAFWSWYYQQSVIVQTLLIPVFAVFYGVLNFAHGRVLQQVVS